MSAENKPELSPRVNESAPNTKLAIVREQLLARPDVYLAGEIHQYHPYAPEVNFWTETVSLIVAPEKPEFNPDKLNDFMYGLIPQIEPSARDEACSEYGGVIRLGELYFDEIIGKLQKLTTNIIETTEPETLIRAGRVIGKTHEEKEYKIQRRTWVRVYPDPISAKGVFEYESSKEIRDPYNKFDKAKYSIDKEFLRELKANYSKGPASKLLDLLHRR